jgi:hypothetical protein
MEMEDITMVATVGWQDQILRPALVQEDRQPSETDTSDNATDDNIMFISTPQPVWPRVWPGL